MSAKDYLRQIEVLSMKIQRRQEQRDELKSMLLPKAIQYDKDKVQTSPKDSMSEIVVKCQQLEEEINTLIGKYVDLKHEIIGQIEMLDDSRYSTILYLRYVKLQRLSQIAEDMNYEYKWLCRLHGYALNDFSKLMNNTNKHD